MDTECVGVEHDRSFAFSRDFQAFDFTETGQIDLIET